MQHTVSNPAAYRLHLVVAVVLLLTARVAAIFPSQPLVHRLIARVTAVSRPPDPATAPYRDALAVTKFRVEEVLDGHGHAPGDDLLAALTVMRDLELLPAARYVIGDRVELSLLPFAQADSLVRQTRQLDDVEDYALDDVEDYALDLYFATSDALVSTR